MLSSGMLCRVALVILCEHTGFLWVMLWWLDAVNVVLSSPILITLMMQVMCFCKMSVLTRANSITSQKMEFFIVTAMKTSNLTSYFLVLTNSNPQT
jgi:hypothetical protein